MSCCGGNNKYALTPYVSGTNSPFVGSGALVPATPTNNGTGAIYTTSCNNICDPRLMQSRGNVVGTSFVNPYNSQFGQNLVGSSAPLVMSNSVGIGSPFQNNSNNVFNQNSCTPVNICSTTCNANLNSNSFCSPPCLAGWKTNTDVTFLTTSECIPGKIATTAYIQTSTATSNKSTTGIIPVSAGSNSAQALTTTPLQSHAIIICDTMTVSGLAGYFLGSNLFGLIGVTGSLPPTANPSAVTFLPVSANVRYISGIAFAYVYFFPAGFSSNGAGGFSFSQNPILIGFFPVLYFNDAGPGAVRLQVTTGPNGLFGQFTPPTGSTVLPNANNTVLAFQFELKITLNC